MKRVAFSFFTLWIVFTGAAQTAPIRLVSPSTGIFLGNVLVGRSVFVEASSDDAAVSTRVNPLAVFFSPTTNTLFGAVVPYVEKRLELPSGEDTVRGVGDASLIGHWRFLNRPGRGFSDMAAARLSVELPTGADSRPVRLDVPEPVRRSLQPGSGSTDLVFTVAAGREHYRYNVNVDAGYRLNTENDGFAFGDEVFADLGFEAFVFPRWTRSRGFEFLLALELGYLHGNRHSLDGESVPDSGGDSFFVSPGIQWLATERVLFEASLRLPAVQDLNGTQPELDRDLLLGFRFAF